MIFYPIKDNYAILFESIKDKNSPWENYAAIKYALALEKQQEFNILKQKLRSLEKDSTKKTQVKHYLYSIKAFEEYMKGNNETALAMIDSAYLYHFDFWEKQFSSMDKRILMAKIYEEKGEFEKAISYLAPTYKFPDAKLSLFEGYCSWKLSQYYEKINNFEKALHYCKVLINSFKNCDTTYQPWVAEVIKRRDKIQAKQL